MKTRLILTLLGILTTSVFYAQSKTDTLKVIAKQISTGVGNKIYIADYRVLQVLKGEISNDTIQVGYYNYKEPKVELQATCTLTLLKYIGIHEKEDFYIFPDYDGVKWVEE